MMPRTACGFTLCGFYELGMIKSSPKRILAEGTDWHFLDEIKRELKT